MNVMKRIFALAMAVCLIAGMLVPVASAETEPHVHNLEHHEAVAATCVQNGMQEYWYCADCDCYFTDAEGKYNIASKSLVIPADGTAHVLQHNAAIEPACHKAGMQENWYCSACDTYYADAEAKYPVARLSLVIPAENALEHHPAIPATHYGNGMQEHWYCPICDVYTTDAQGMMNIARLSLVIPATCGLTYVEAKEACHVPGSQEYWYCVECQAVFADAEGKILTNRKNLEIAPDCELEHHEAVAATTKEEGMKEYWYCPECDCYFADAEGKYNVARLSLIIPKIDNATPSTGDSIMLWVVLATVAVMGMACVIVLNKKKVA